MFGPIGPTPYDLCFSVAGIPVRVLPTFWLGAVLMGSGLLDSGHFELLLIWVACLFVSILVHELGHAVMARAFGWPPQVYLYHFGGLAVYSPHYGHTTGRSIAISLAGPVAGFCLYGAVWTLTKTVNSPLLSRGHGGFAVDQLEWINLWWGLVNLLPVLPLDGGRISNALCDRYYRGSGDELAAKISVVVAGCVAAWFLTHHVTYGGFLFLLLCVQNVQALQSFRGRW